MGCALWPGSGVAPGLCSGPEDGVGVGAGVGLVDPGSVDPVLVELGWGVGRGVTTGGGVTTSAWHESVMVFENFQTLMVRWPETCPKLTWAEVRPVASVAVRSGVTASRDEGELLIDQCADWPLTRWPVATSVTVALTVTTFEHGTVCEGPDN